MTLYACGIILTKRGNTEKKQNGNQIMNIIEINSLTSKALEPYVGLNEKQLKRFYEPAEGIFICESEKVIRRAVKAGYNAESFFVCEDKIDLAAELSQKDTPVYHAPVSVMEAVTGYSLTGGILAVMRRHPPADPSVLIQDRSKIVIMDDIENPTNVGAIFRSACALGAEAVLLTQGCADPLYRRAARVSMGTVFQVDWTYMDKSFMNELKSSGFMTVALSLSDDAEDISVISGFNGKKAVVLGNEDHGISAEILSQCDKNVIIPMKNGVDSLNVASAGAIAFYAAFR